MLHTIARAFVDGDDLVLAHVIHRIAIHRNHQAINRHRRRVRHVVVYLARRLGQQTVASANFLFCSDYIQRRCFRNALFAAICRAADGFGPHQASTPGKAAFIPQHFFRGRVFDWRGIAEYPVHIGFFIFLILQCFAIAAAGIDAIAGTQNLAAIFGAHNPVGFFQRILIHNQRLGQEWLDQMHRNRGNRLRFCIFDAHTRLQLHRTAWPAANATPRTQARAAIDNFQPQSLPRINQVRIADLLQIHAPQLGPAPGFFEEFARNAPQGIALLDHIFGRRIGRQLAHGHAARSRGLCDLTLLGRRRILLRKRRRSPCNARQQTYAGKRLDCCLQCGRRMFLKLFLKFGLHHGRPEYRQKDNMHSIAHKILLQTNFLYLCRFGGD